MNTLHPVMADILRSYTPHVPRPTLRCSEPEPVEQICNACAGSGEGLFDGTTCRVCKGQGEVWVTE